MNPPRCPECDELWREYAKATIEHVKLIKQQEIAAEFSIVAFRDLEESIQIAEKRRAEARDAVRSHLTSRHRATPKSSSTTSR